MEELGRLTQIGGHGGVAYLLEKVGEELEQRHVRLRPLRHRDSLVFFCRKPWISGWNSRLALPFLLLGSRWCCRAPVGDLPGQDRLLAVWHSAIREVEEEGKTDR